MPSLRRRLGRLEKFQDAAVFVIGSSWSPDRAHDLGLEAGRVFVETVRRRCQRKPHHARALVVVAGRGGHPSFAEIAVRALRAHYEVFDVLVPYSVNGAVSLIALGADRVLLHPYAGLGAVDVGPVTLQEAFIDAIVYEDVPALGGLGAPPESLAGRLATERHWKRMARNLAARLTRATPEDVPVLVDELGTDLSLGAAELIEAGLVAETIDEKLAALAWSLYEDIEERLGILNPPPAPYTHGDLADEVEYLPAEGLIGAFVQSSRDLFTYTMDTGRPHPDTNVYLGEWNL